jgi:hypothetical protein
MDADRNSFRLERSSWPVLGLSVTGADLSGGQAHVLALRCGPVASWALRAGWRGWPGQSSAS